MNISVEPKPKARHEERVDYEAIVSVIDEGVFILRNGRIVFANPAFSRLTGRSNQEAIGLRFVEVVPLSHKNVVKKFMVEFEKEKGESQAIKFPLAGPPAKLLEMKVSFIQYRQRKALLGRLLDITENRKKTLAAQRLHLRLRSILDSVHHGILSFSFHQDSDKPEEKTTAFYDANLVEVNPAAESLYGVPKEVFLKQQKSIFDFVHEQDRWKVLEHYRNLRKKGSGMITYRIVRTDREIRWVQDYGKVEYQGQNRVRRVNHIIEDITGRKKALDELRANERKYRRIFERSKDMIYVVDFNGNFIDINPSGLKLLGLISKEEAAFRNIKEFYVDQRVREALLKELMEKGEASSSRVMLWKSGNETIEVDLNAIAKRDANGKIVSYQGIVTNITEALRQRELESIARLAGCFADDLASPLNVIMINLGAIEEDLAEFKHRIVKNLDNESTVAATEMKKLVQRYCENLMDLNQSAMTASKEITARLKEIREEYWRLNKVPDGTGGLIYERLGKWGPKPESVREKSE